VGHDVDVLNERLAYISSLGEENDRKMSVEVGKKKRGSHSKIEIPASYLRVQFRNSRTAESQSPRKRSCSDLVNVPLNLPPCHKIASVERSS
jgi:hypothetical protein